MHVLVILADRHYVINLTRTERWTVSCLHFNHDNNNSKTCIFFKSKTKINLTEQFNSNHHKLFQIITKISHTIFLLSAFEATICICL